MVSITIPREQVAYLIDRVHVKHEVNKTIRVAPFIVVLKQGRERKNGVITDNTEDECKIPDLIDLPKRQA